MLRAFGTLAGNVLQTALQSGALELAGAQAAGVLGEQNSNHREQPAPS